MIYIYFVKKPMTVRNISSVIKQNIHFVWSKIETCFQWILTFDKKMS